MQLAILAAVLVAIASIGGDDSPVAGLAWRLLVVASAALVAPLAALVGTQKLAFAIADDDESDRAISRLQSALAGLWLVAVGTILLIAQWPRIVRNNWGLGQWPLIDELMILLPVIAPLLLVWAALFRLERAAYIAACMARQVVPSPPNLGSYLWLNVRHQLALVLLPPLAVVGTFETLESLNVAPVRLAAAWWFMLPLAGMMLVLMPVAVRRIWKTTPLMGALRTALDDVCRRRRCRLRDILIWQTDGTMANAAVIGISRWLRYMLLSDVLVSRLSDDEIAAVVRHELAHLRRWHLPLRLAVLVLPVAWWLALTAAWPAAGETMQILLDTCGVSAHALSAFAIPLGMLIYAVVALGWYSRLLEHDADLDACLTDEGTIDRRLMNHFARALWTLCGRGHESWLTQWLHPPVGARLQFVRRVVDDPGYAASFRRRLAAITAAIALLFAGALVIAAL